MTEPQLAMIDGRDALLMVLVKPGSGEGMVSVDAHCNGLDKLQAARILMHVAKSWKAEADAAQQSGEPSHDRDRDGICQRCGQGLTALDIVDGEKPCPEVCES